jgi:hypothetical protein
METGSDPSALVSLGVNGLTTVAAAFAGAWVAFLLESRRRAKEIEDARVGGANRALYGLVTMWEILHQYQSEHIEPNRNDPDFWLNLAPAPPIDWKPLFDGRDISFLLDTPLGRGVFQRTLGEERRFRLAMSLLQRHADLTIREVHSRIADAGVRPGQVRTSAEFEEILGIRVVLHLKSYTRDIVGFIDEDVATIPQTFADLRAAIVEQFPRRSIIDANFDATTRPT